MNLIGHNRNRGTLVRVSMYYIQNCKLNRLYFVYRFWKLLKNNKQLIVSSIVTNNPGFQVKKKQVYLPTSRLYTHVEKTIQTTRVYVDLIKIIVI